MEACVATQLQVPGDELDGQVRCSASRSARATLHKDLCGRRVHRAAHLDGYTALQLEHWLLPGGGWKQWRGPVLPDEDLVVSGVRVGRRAIGRLGRVERRPVAACLERGPRGDRDLITGWLVGVRQVVNQDPA